MFSCIGIYVIWEVAGDHEHSQKTDHVELHYDFFAVDADIQDL